MRFADSISMTSSGSAARSYSIEANSFQPFAVDVAAKSPLALDDRMLLVELHAAWIASTDGAVEKESLLALVEKSTGDFRREACQRELNVLRFFLREGLTFFIWRIVPFTSFWDHLASGSQ